MNELALVGTVVFVILLALVLGWSTVFGCLFALVGWISGD